MAIKVLREVLSRDSGSVRRLVEEARAAIRLAHPNVVRVHDYHDTGAIEFLAMEYVEGETLADRLGRDRKLSEEETRRIGTQVCLGLEHAHANRVIHRDLKPGNILLGKDGSVKIADFGIARVCRDSISRLTSQMDSGTLLYMSPEQLLGKSSEASDVYSLGVVLYEMLAGEPPFHSGDISYQIREVVPEPPDEILPEMRAIVMKCLEKKPDRRFASAGDLRAELDGTAARARREAAERAHLEAERRKQEEEKARAEQELCRAEEQRRAEAERRQSDLEEEQARQEEDHRKRLRQGPSSEKAAGIRESGGPEPVAAVLEQPRVMTNILGMGFVRVPVGKFIMGCSPGDSECFDEEKPAHEVQIKRDFELQVTEVTQGQWQAVMGNNPSSFKGDDNLPVESVSWDDAHQFLEKLNSQADGYRYRLPTEAEWEYAARGGVAQKYYGSLDSIAWYGKNSGGKTHPVKGKQPNKYGLNDMLGNVWEWCEDWHGDKYYRNSPSADPKGPDSGQFRVLRGGSWHSGPRNARVSSRSRNVPGNRSNKVGFRCARERIP